MEQIFFLQSKMFCHPKAETMLEDLAIKGILAGFPEWEIVNGIMVYYRQCEEVARNIYERAKKVLN